MQSHAGEIIEERTEVTGELSVAGVDMQPLKNILQSLKFASIKVRSLMIIDQV